jgi:hypothetical protein
MYRGGDGQVERGLVQIPSDGACGLVGGEIRQFQRAQNDERQSRLCKRSLWADCAMTWRPVGILAKRKAGGICAKSQR